MKKSLFAFGFLAFMPLVLAQDTSDIFADLENELLEPTDSFIDTLLEDPIIPTETVVENTSEAIPLSILETPLEETIEAIDSDFIPEIDQAALETFQTQSDSLTPAMLPASARQTLSVVNISQDSQEATVTDAKPGDILRYEFTINSETEDVKNFLPNFDVTEILKVATITDAGLGVLDGNKLNYPLYSHLAPCEQSFVFFAQIKEDCGEMANVTVGIEGEVATVNLTCKLSKTGPESVWAVTIILAILGGLMFWAVGSRRA